MVGSPSANHWVDVTDRFDQKMASLRAHESQTAHLADVAELIRSRLAQQAAEAGLAPGRLAEAFQVVSTR
jgi:LmbE family N-acetylglucosaminyl deacetylase